MKKAKIVYSILWLLATIAFFLPWASMDSKSYSGLNFTVPFSFTYLIGILLGLIVILTERWKFALTMLAGILMILGVLGAALGYSVVEALAGFTGGKISSEFGSGLSLLLSIVYLVVGSMLARKF
jgi:hypothetical protein